MACTEDSDWGNSVSRITHTKEENLKRIRMVNGSLFTSSFPMEEDLPEIVFPFVVLVHPKDPPKDFLAIVFSTVKFTFHAV